MERIKIFINKGTTVDFSGTYTEISEDFSELGTLKINYHLHKFPQTGFNVSGWYSSRLLITYRIIYLDKLNFPKFQIFSFSSDFFVTYNCPRATSNWLERLLDGWAIQRPLIGQNQPRGTLSTRRFCLWKTRTSYRRCRSTPARYAANPYPKGSHPMLKTNSKHLLNSWLWLYYVFQLLCIYTDTYIYVSLTMHINMGTYLYGT